MYNQPYFIPSYMSSMATPTMMRGMGAMRGLGAASVPFMSGTATAGKGLGLMRRLGAGLSSFRSINWTGLINNASKTLGVVNQAIPLVRQVGPMVNNMKSMIKVASLFKDETDQNRKRTNIRPSNNNTSYTQNAEIDYSMPNRKNSKNINNINKEESTNSTLAESDSPTFFIPS